MSSDKKPKIAPASNGPYIVKDVNRFTNKNGAIDTTEPMALCRCGASSNKPFCDGTHAKTGFTSDKLEGRLENKQVSYRGREITIHDNRSVCAHAGYCTDNLAEVFRMKQEPWIDSDAAPVEDIIAAIAKCPSGALSYSIDDVDHQATESEAAIHIAPNGPYVVSGGVELNGAEWGDGVSKNEYTLCRCGASKNKPFCDGSHWSIEFSDDKN